MKKIFVALVLTAILFSLPIMFINNSAFQQWFLQTYRPFAPWKIDLERMAIQPIPLLLSVQKLKMEHPSGHQIQLESGTIRIKFWRLLRGQLSLDPLAMEGLHVTVAKSLKPAKKRRPFKLRTLLLIQNLLIEEGRIQNIFLSLPSKQIKFPEIDISLKPHLLGGTALKIGLSRLEKPKSGRVVLEVVTRFDHWSKNFPYVNDVEGSLYLHEFDIGRLPVEAVEAKIKYKNFRLYSERFLVQTRGRRLLGKLESHLKKQTFQVKLATPEAIPISEIGDSLRIFNVAGELQLDLELEGKGFKPTQSEGKGTIKITHRFAENSEHPVDLEAPLHWSQGVLHLPEAKIGVAGSTIQAKGSLPLKPFSLDLEFSGQNFPLTHFFRKFEDANLRPIFGKGTFEGKVTGMGKTIHLQVLGEVTEGGYTPLLAQKASVQLDMTDAGLKLRGLIVTDGKETGQADLAIDYGPKRPGQVRPKTIHLEARFQEHPLETLLPDPYLSGLASASLKLDGPAKGFEGNGELSTQNGELAGIAFESLQFPFQLTPKQLRIEKARWVVAHAEKNFTDPLIFDFIPGGGLNISGKPSADLQLNVTYHPLTREWNIHSLRYLEAELQGLINPENIALMGKGGLDLTLLQPLGRLFREIGGPCDFELQVKGPLKNPAIHGQIALKKNLLSPRAFPLTTEELEGVLYFSGHTLRTDRLTGQMGFGSFLLRGEMTHEGLAPKTWDLTLKGNQLYFRNRPGFFRMEYDTDLIFKGSRQNALLKGDITILDGRYTKDFNIIEEIKEAKKPAREIQTAIDEGIPIRMDLKVHNLGDLLIDNNIGRIELEAEFHLTGTTLLPHVEGSVEVAEGQIHYLGLDFDITRGFMEFRDPYTTPYLEVEGEQEIADAHLTARLHGRTDNLVMELSGNSATLGPLEQKDVISLMLFGITTSERHQQSQYSQLELGPELMAEQVAHILQRPIAKATGLDIFRMEASPTKEGRQRSLHIGKRITDRFHVEFTSDVDREEAVQTFLLEYWLTDFFILKGARESEEEYQLNVGLRVQAR